ncbi:MAG: hypothetical protein JRH20_30875 [Deltaproteobacteria bacterium]|nr:hypothetical protein [Deltaproteobacteria bacterium]
MGHWDRRRAAEFSAYALLHRRCRLANACGLFVSLMLFGACACETGPDRQQAAKWYQQHKETVDAIDRDLRLAVKKMIAFQDKFRCHPRPTKEHSKRPQSDASKHIAKIKKSLKPLLTEMHCTSQELKRLERHNKQMAAFNRAALPRVLERQGVLGVQIRYFKSGDSSSYSLGNIGSVAGGMHDKRLKGADVLEVGGRRIGWGRFQTAYQRGGGKRYGDGKQHNGILVSWEFTSGNDTRFVAVIVVMATHSTTVEWRTGWNKPVSAQSMENER